MGLHHYRFRTVWHLDARPGAVFAVLERAEEYPRWWPQVREVVPGGDDSGRVRLRSFLPYELRVTARALRREPGAGVLEIALGGDLEGRAGWRITPEGDGTRVVYEQEVEVRRRLMRLLALPGRPLFRANHTFMMRAGRRGLAALLAEPPGGPK
jgi:uncharacterized protein YndB with AHSA1/START domain